MPARGSRAANPVPVSFAAMGGAKESDPGIDAICARAVSHSEPVASRMRAIFSLQSYGGFRAIETLATVLRKDPSVLAKHEAAYCLGQMRDSAALPYLEASLVDMNEDPVVRHEAGEALGAIGSSAVLPLLDKYSADVHPREVYETCQLAAARIRLTRGEAEGKGGSAPKSMPFKSVDPAPATSGVLESCEAIQGLQACLCDPAVDLFERYRSMFALRNIGGEGAVSALCEGMRSETSSALFRHEVAFVLGQLQSPTSTETLAHFLRDTNEHEMVRHEAAEALGSIATPESEAILREFREDPNDVVRESVAVALDISDHVSNPAAFHYADKVAPVVEMAPSSVTGH